MCAVCSWTASHYDGQTGTDYCGPRLIARFSRRRRLAYASSVCLVIYCLISLTHYDITGTAYSNHRLEKNNNKKEDPIANATWVKMRTKLLRECNVTKVFLFTYMRGGSSLFGELFNLDPSRSILFYEPLDAFYQSYAALYPHSLPLSLLYDTNFTQRSISEIERVEMFDYLDSLLACRIDKLPIETFAHSYFGYTTAFKRPAECMDRKFAKKMVSDCIDPVKSICGNDDEIRRNMSIATANKCPEFIRALKATLPDELHPATNTYKNLNRSTDYLMLKTKVSKLVEGFTNDDERTLDAFIDYHTCKAKAKFILKNCMGSIEATCKQAQLIALKVIRSRMKDLELLIQRIPDIHVLYYTRDPRAIVNSRLDLPLPLLFSTGKSAVAESKILCHRMWEDIKSKKLLERKYPGSIITIRYEDFVHDLNGTSLKVFDTIKYPPSAEYYRWLNKTERGSTFNGPYGTKRPNVTASIDKWKLSVSLHDGIEMTRQCFWLLAELGYDI